MKKIKKLFNYLAKRIFLIIDMLISIEVVLITLANINNEPTQKYWTHFYRIL